MTEWATLLTIPLDARFSHALTALRARRVLSHSSTYLLHGASPHRVVGSERERYRTSTISRIGSTTEKRFLALSMQEPSDARPPLASKIK
jgi:hypothetical protein